MKSEKNKNTDTNDEIIYKVSNYWKAIWAVLSENESTKQIYAQFNDELEEYLKRKSIGRLKKIDSEFRLWMLEWPDESVSKVRTFLPTNLTADFDKIKMDSNAVLNKILRSKKIKDQVSYDIVQNFINDSMNSLSERDLASLQESMAKFSLNEKER